MRLTEQTGEIDAVLRERTADMDAFLANTQRPDNRRVRDGRRAAGAAAMGEAAAADRRRGLARGQRAHRAHHRGPHARLAGSDGGRAGRPARQAWTTCSDGLVRSSEGIGQLIDEASRSLGSLDDRLLTTADGFARSGHRPRPVAHRRGLALAGRQCGAPVGCLGERDRRAGRRWRSRFEEHSSHAGDARRAILREAQGEADRDAGGAPRRRWRRSIGRAGRAVDAARRDPARSLEARVCARAPSAPARRPA